MSAPRYDLRTHQGSSPDLVSVQQSPGAVIAVVRFASKLSWDFTSAASNSQGPVERLGEYSDVLQLQDQCLHAQVSQSKSSHTQSFSATFMDPDHIILYTVAPGDWLMVWMTDTEEQAASVADRVRKKKQANLFFDGLKFVGRVQSVRVDHQAATEGMTTRRTTISGVSFQEFDSLIYYDPRLLSGDGDSNLSWMPDTSYLDTHFSELQNNRTVAKTQDIISLMIDVFIGRGPGTADGEVEGLPKTPNQALLVPDTIGKLLGRKETSRAGGDFTFADIVATIIGVQKYDGDVDKISARRDAFESIIGLQPLLPVPSNDDAPPFRAKTNTDLQGVFIPVVQPWNAPIWQILEGYLNPAVNEMYTCLKMGYDGSVLPHLIVRQIPFNTDQFDLFSQIAFKMPTTRFLELPRWVLDANMVWSWNVGRSDSLRVNYTSVLVQAYTNGSSPAEISERLARILGDPVPDPEDIQRHGLRPFITTVATAPDATTDTPTRAWSTLAMDRLAGGHLKLSGSIQAAGITEPIAPGDNIEYDGIVYHIEDIQHTFTIEQGSAKRKFVTAMSISNGVTTDPVWPWGYLQFNAEDAQGNATTIPDPLEHVGEGEGLA